MPERLLPTSRRTQAVSWVVSLTCAHGCIVIADACGDVSSLLEEQRENAQVSQWPAQKSFLGVPPLSTSVGLLCNLELAMPKDEEFMDFCGLFCGRRRKADLVSYEKTFVCDFYAAWKVLTHGKGGDTGRS